MRNTESKLPPRLLNCQSAARYLGMERHNWRLIRPSLDIRPVIIAKREMWDVKDLDKLIDEKKEVARLAAITRG